jgi:DAACS family dicarboxylate/amino acid:cation (Na+ or H+) symporter
MDSVAQAPSVAEPRARDRIALRLILAIGAGAITGSLAGPRAAGLGELGVLIIQLLKTLATPLIFFAVVDALCTTRIEGRQAARLLAISLVNAAVAAFVALSVARLIPAGRWVSLEGLRQAIGDTPAETSSLKLDFGATLRSIVPSSVVEPFATNHVIAVVLLAVLTGLAVRSLERDRPEEARLAARAASAGFALLSRLLRGIVHVVPVAVFCVVAKVAGTTGLSVFRALGVFVALVATGLAIHCLLYYSLLLKLVARVSPLAFFRDALEAILTALGTGSSLATLPVTLRTLQEKMRVSPESSRLAACVGTNLNHDGILLYEAAAALFIAQVHGIALEPGRQVVVVLTSALAAVGIAGVPDAGLITLSLVLGAVGLPLAAVPLLLPVDWLLGRLRAATNVISDMTVARVLERFRKPD